MKYTSFCIAIILLATRIYSQPFISTTNPTSCNNLNGEIKISGLSINSTYVISYKLEANLVTLVNQTTDANGVIKLSNLLGGTYSDFAFTPTGGTKISYPGPIFLKDGCHISTKLKMPSSSMAGDGAIEILGLTANTKYGLDYTFVNSDKISQYVYNDSIVADANGIVTIPNLTNGQYSGFSINGIQQNVDVLLVDQISYIASNSNAMWSAAFYGALNGVPDDNPSTYNEMYLSVAIPLNRYMGIPSNSKFGHKPGSAKFLDGRLIPSRSLLIQGNYSSNVNPVPALYNDTSKNPIRYVNQLDMLKYSKIRLTLNMNLLTYIIPKYHHYGDLGHFYLDLTGAIFATSVTDSTFGTNNPFLVKSLLLGFATKYKAKNLTIANTTTPLGFEIGVQLFWINTFSNDVNAHMNIQYSDKAYSDLTNPLNLKKSFIVPNEPYLHADMLIYYNTGKNNDSLSSSNIFFHASYYTNIASPTSNYMSNSYIQFQLGYALSINKLLSTFKK